MNNPYMAPAPSAVAEPYRSDERVTVSDGTVTLLQQTKPWVTFLSVMAFLGAAFMLLGGIGMMFVGAAMPSTGPRSNSPFPVWALGLVYLPMGALYVYPGMKLWAFSSAIGRLVASRSVMDLESALGQQKSFWKFSGITTIILMAVYGVFVVGMVIVGVTTAASAVH